MLPIFLAFARIGYWFLQVLPVQAYTCLIVRNKMLLQPIVCDTVPFLLACLVWFYSIPALWSTRIFRKSKGSGSIVQHFRSHPLTCGLQALQFMDKCPLRTLHMSFKNIWVECSIGKVDGEFFSILANIVKYFYTLWTIAFSLIYGLHLFIFGSYPTFTRSDFWNWFISDGQVLQ